jgi:hypothetical protein
VRLATLQQLDVDTRALPENAQPLGLTRRDDRAARMEPTPAGTRIGSGVSPVPSTSSLSAADEFEDSIDGEAGDGVAVHAGHRVGNEQSVGHGFLAGVDDRGEHRVE